MRASGMDTLSSMTMTPAEPIMVPAALSPSTSMVTSISAAVRIAADPPPGTTAFSRPVPLTPPAIAISCRKVIDTGASYTAGFFTRPDTEYMRVPPCVLVPSPANHSAPRAMIGGTQASVSTLLTIVGCPKAPLMAGKGGLILGQPFLPSSDDSSPVSSPQIYAPAPRWTTTSNPLPSSPASYASLTAAPKRRHGSTYSPRM